MSRASLFLLFTDVDLICDISQNNQNKTKILWHFASFVMAVHSALSPNKTELLILLFSGHCPDVYCIVSYNT